MPPDPTTSFELVAVRDHVAGHQGRGNLLSRARLRAPLPRRRALPRAPRPRSRAGRARGCSCRRRRSVIRSRPRLSASSVTRFASSFDGFLVAGSATSSIASIEPSPRTSPIAGQRSCHASIRARIVSPIVAERSTSPSSSITSSTASAAACATGLPTKVPPTPPGDGRVHDLGAAEHTRERQSVRDRLRDADQVGLDARVLHREEPAGTAEPGLHLVGDEHDPVRVADPRERRRRTRAARR